MTSPAPVLLMDIREFDQEQIGRLGIGRDCARLFKYEDGDVLCYPCVRISTGEVTCLSHPYDRCAGVVAIEHQITKENGR